MLGRRIVHGSDVYWAHVAQEMDGVKIFERGAL